MKKILIVVLGFVAGSVVSAQAASTEVFERIQADCSSVKECACQEVCYDVCRIVNNEQVCDESCQTVCEYGTSAAKSKPSTGILGNGSEACVTHCGDAADESCGDDSKCRSAFFNGCMRTCWM